MKRIVLTFIIYKVCAKNFDLRLKNVLKNIFIFFD